MSTLNLKAVLGFDGRGFQAGMVHAERAANRFGSNVLGGLKGQLAAAFSAGAVVALTRELGQLAGVIKDNANRLDVSTTTFQEFAFAARRGGSDAQHLTTSFEKFIDALEKVKNGEAGSDKLLLILQRYGITLEKIKSQNAESIFRELGVALQSTSDGGQVTADMIDLLGKSGGKLIPVLRSLKSDSEKLRGSFNFMTEEEVKQFDRAGKQLDEFGTGLKLLGGRGISGVKGMIGSLLSATSPFSFVREAGDTALDDTLAAFENNELKSKGSQAFKIKLMEDELRSKKPKKKSDVEILEEQKKAAKAAEDSEKKLASLAEETESIREQYRLAQMSEEEKLNELLEKRVKLEFQIAHARKNGIGGEFLAQSVLDLAKVELGISGFKNTKEVKTPASSSPIQTDSLLRVGNFLGASGPAISTIDQKLLESSIQVARNTKVIAEYLTKPRAATGRLSDNV